MRRQVRLCAAFFLLALSPKVSAYADDITVFVSRCLGIKVEKAVVSYEQIGGAKINFDMNEYLRLCA